MFTTLDIIFFCMVGAFLVYFITHMVLYASNKKFRKKIDERMKRNEEWMKQYKIKSYARKRFPRPDHDSHKDRGDCYGY